MAEEKNPFFERLLKVIKSHPKEVMSHINLVFARGVPPNVPPSVEAMVPHLTIKVQIPTGGGGTYMTRPTPEVVVQLREALDLVRAELKALSHTSTTPFARALMERGIQCVRLHVVENKPKNRVDTKIDDAFIGLPKHAASTKVA